MVSELEFPHDLADDPGAGSQAALTSERPDPPLTDKTRTAPLRSVESHDDNSARSGGRIQRLTEWAQQDVWHVELGGVPTFKRLWTKSIRVFLIAVRGFVRDQCTRHAMALTYITIFALPPFLAFVFSIAKGFGVYKSLKEGTIDSFLDSNFGTEDGGQVRQAIDQIFTYVENTPLGSVAAIGLLVILYAVFKLLGAIEFTLNDIWGIRRSRPFVRKVTDYLAIVAVTPVLLISGAGMTAFLNGRVAEFVRDRQDDQPAATAGIDGGVESEQEAGVESGEEASAGAAENSEAPEESLNESAPSTEGEAAGAARNLNGRITPGRPARPPTKLSVEDPVRETKAKSPLLKLISTLTIVLGMAFVIFTMPNTAVKLWPALLGGLVAGLLWQLLQFGSVYVQVWLAGKNAIYSSLAAIPMLMIWIYLSWTILLVGAEAACALQTEPVVTSTARTGKIDQRLREVLAPRLAVRVVRAFTLGHKPPTADALASEIELAPRAVSQILEHLVTAGILARTSTDEDDEGYLPGRDPATIRLQDILTALRRDEGSRPPDPHGPLDALVDQTRSTLEREVATSTSNKTLRELAAMDTATEAAAESDDGEERDGTA